MHTPTTPLEHRAYLAGFSFGAIHGRMSTRGRQRVFHTIGLPDEPALRTAFRVGVSDGLRGDRVQVDASKRVLSERRCHECGGILAAACDDDDFVCEGHGC